MDLECRIKKKICFVSHNIYPVLKKTDEKFVGGAEIQQALIGKYLKLRGYEVSYITGVYDNNRKEECIDGMKIFKTYSCSDGIPGIRFIYPRNASLWKMLMIADADIYYQRCADYVTGTVALFCKLNKKIFVYSASHDTNFIPDLIKVPYLRDKILYIWGLRNATHVVVQTCQQKKLLFENFGIKSHVIENIYEKKELIKGKRFVLWVGNIKKDKRPELLLEIAKKVPKIKFKMIGGLVKRQEKLYKKIEKEAIEIENVEFLGFKTFEETEAIFDEASLFISTSECEGFPNTFLQSWARGIPTITFFDPDHIVLKNNLGLVVESVENLGDILIKFMGSSVSYRGHIQKYFNENHAPEKYVDKFERMLWTSIW